MVDKSQIDLTANSSKLSGQSSQIAANALVAVKKDVLAGPQAPERAARSKSVWGRWRLRLAVLVAAGVAGWLFYAQPWSPGGPAIQVEAIAEGPVTRVLAVSGRTAALHSVVIRSNVAGTLVDPLAEEGDVVPQGAVLARLDDTSQRAALRQAVAALDQGLVTREQARAALERAQSLGTTVSRVTLDDAGRAAEVADREVGRLTALVDQAQFQLTRYSILAPLAGTILTRGVEPGQVVDLTTQLFELADLRDLVVETDVDESYATQIRPGMPARLQLTGSSQIVPGTVSFVSPLVDAATGGLAVKIAFSEAQQAPVGLTVTANIVVDRQERAITAPRSAIIRQGQDTSVFVILDGKLHKTDVEVIEWPSERLIVTRGLKAGDILAVDVAGLVDGQAVLIAGAP